MNHKHLAGYCQTLILSVILNSGTLSVLEDDSLKNYVA